MEILNNYRFFVRNIVFEQSIDKIIVKTKLIIWKTNERAYKSISLEIRAQCNQPRYFKIK